MSPKQILNVWTNFTKKIFFSPYSKVDLQPPIAIFTAAPCILHLVALEVRLRPRRQQQAPSPPLLVQRTNLRLQLPPCNKHPPKLRLEQPQRPLAEDLPMANGLFPKVLMFDSLTLCQWTELLKIQVSIYIVLISIMAEILLEIDSLISCTF